MDIRQLRVWGMRQVRNGATGLVQRLANPVSCRLRAGKRVRGMLRGKRRSGGEEIQRDEGKAGRVRRRRRAVGCRGGSRSKKKRPTSDGSGS